MVSTVLQLVLISTLRMSVPYILASTGANFASRVGVSDLGCEGMMIAGSFFSVLGSYLTNSPWLGLLFGILAGMIFALIHGGLHITFKVIGAISGVSINLLAAAITPLFLKLVWNSESMSPAVPAFEALSDSWINNIPIVGSYLGGQNIIFYVALAIVLISYIFLFKTKQGLRTRMVGEDPVAAHSIGINTTKTKYMGVLACGALAGLGGAYLSIGQMNMFIDGITSGRGYICMVINAIGGYNPIGSVLGSVFFAFFESLRSAIQSTVINPNFLMMLPYVMTLILIVACSRNRLPPAGVGKHYDD